MSEPVLSLVPKLTDSMSNQSVIEQLERFLEMARKGEIVGLCVAGYDKSRGAIHATIPGANPVLLLGEMTQASYSLARYRAQP